MYSKTKQMLGIVLSASLIVSSVASGGIFAKAAKKNEQITASYGENLKYTYYKDKNGKSSESALFVDGAGSMENLTEGTVAEQFEKQPWMKECYEPEVESAADITSDTKPLLGEIYIGDEVTALGEYCFANYSNCKIYLGKNITKLPKGCFQNVNNVKIYVSGVITDLENDILVGADDNSEMYFEDAQTYGMFCDWYFDANYGEGGSDWSGSPYDGLPAGDQAFCKAVREGNILLSMNPDGEEYNAKNWEAYQTALSAAAKYLKTAVNKRTADQEKTLLDALNKAKKDLTRAKVLTDAQTAAAALDESLYTASSWEVLQKALQDAETIGEDADDETIQAAAKAITDAIAGLQELDKAESYTKLQDLVKQTDGLIEQDYKSAGWTALEQALETAAAVTEESSLAEIIEAKKQMQTALDGLEVYYGEEQPLAGIVYQEPTLILSGTVDDQLVGAVKAVFVFDCNAGVSYNSYTTWEVNGNVGGTDLYQKFTGKDDSYAAGTKGWKEEVSFSAMRKGASYLFNGNTYSWQSIKGSVFEVQRVEFYDADGKLLKSFRYLPTENLKTAYAAAKKTLNGLKASDYTEESYQAFVDAVENAQKILGMDTPLPSRIEAAGQQLELAQKGLKKAPVIATPTPTVTPSPTATATVTPTPSQSPSVTPSTVPSPSVAPSTVPSSSAAPGVTGKPGVTATQTPSVKKDQGKAPVKPAIKKVTAKKAKWKITLKKADKSVQGYQIVIAKDKKCKKIVKKVTVKGSKKTFKINSKKWKLKKGKKYYVKIRSYRNTKAGKKYSAYSKVKRVKIK